MSSRFKITPHKRTCFILLVFMLIHIAAGGLLGLIPDISSYLKTALSLFVSAACVSTLYISTSKTNIIRFFRIKKITFTEAVMWFFLGICANCALTIINIPVSMLWEHFDIFPEGIGAPQSLLQYFFGIICIGVAPALFEEILCRGIVLREYENYGKKAALFVSAAAFALLHRDITSLVMTFLLGLMLAYVVFMSDSIFPAMIFHFAVNFFSLTAGYISENVIPPHMLPDFSLVLNLGTVLLALTFVLAAVTVLASRAENFPKSAADRPSPPKFGFSISLLVIISIYVCTQADYFLHS